MTKDFFDFAFFKGDIVPIEQANVPVMTNALQYGTGFFGGIRVYYNADDKAAYIFRLKDHCARFVNSAKLLEVTLPYSADELFDIIKSLAEKNNPKTDAYLRPFAYVGSTALGPNLVNTTMDFALYMIPLSEYIPVDKGLSVCISKWQRVPKEAIPVRAKASGIYINSALARKEASDGGYDEAILLGANGKVSEGSAENIFIVKDNVLITPSLSEDILEGITRRTIMELAKEMDITLQEKPISKEELLNGDEVFMTGTGCQVAWIKSIDKHMIADGKIGPITKKLQQKYFNIVRGIDKDHAGWRTKLTTD